MVAGIASVRDYARDGAGAIGHIQNARSQRHQIIGSQNPVEEAAGNASFGYRLEPKGNRSRGVSVERSRVASYGK